MADLHRTSGLMVARIGKEFSSMRWLFQFSWLGTYGRRMHLKISILTRWFGLQRLTLSDTGRSRSKSDGKRPAVIRRLLWRSLLLLLSVPQILRAREASTTMRPSCKTMPIFLSLTSRTGPLRRKVRLFRKLDGTTFAFILLLSASYRRMRILIMAC